MRHSLPTTPPRTNLLQAWFAALLTAIALAVMWPTSSAAAQGVWTQVPTTGTPMSGRSTPAAAALGVHVYLFGGMRDDFATQQNTFYNDLYRFNTVTSRWDKLAPTGAVPPARVFAAGVAVPHRQWFAVFGGSTFPYDISSFTVFNDLWVYDALNNRWTQRRPANAGPSGRSRPAMWQVGDALYVFGGINASFQTLNDLWVYDIAANTWTQLRAQGAAGSPPPRHEAMTGAEPAFGRLTVYGGETITEQGFVTLGDTWQYDLLQRTWTEVTPVAAKNITSPRSFAASASIGPYLYVQGGDFPGGSNRCGSPFPQNPTDELWQFDGFTRAWTQLKPQGDPMPKLKRTVAVSIGARMFVFAGFDFRCTYPNDAGQIWNESVNAFTPFGSRSR